MEKNVYGEMYDIFLLIQFKEYFLLQFDMNSMQIVEKYLRERIKYLSLDSQILTILFFKILLNKKLSYRNNSDGDYLFQCHQGYLIYNSLSTVILRCKNGDWELDGYSQVNFNYLLNS